MHVMNIIHEIKKAYLSTEEQEKYCRTSHNVVISTRGCVMKYSETCFQNSIIPYFKTTTYDMQVATSNVNMRLYFLTLYVHKTSTSHLVTFVFYNKCPNNKYKHPFCTSVRFRLDFHQMIS